MTIADENTAFACKLQFTPVDVSLRKKTKGVRRGESPRPPDSHSERSEESQKTKYRRTELCRRTAQMRVDNPQASLCSA